MTTDASEGCSGWPGLLVIVLVIYGVICAITALSDLLSKYSSYSFPYNIVTGFYYWLCAGPWTVLALMFKPVATGLGPTPYPNLNRVLCVVLNVIVWCGVIYLFVRLRRRYHSRPTFSVGARTIGKPRLRWLIPSTCAFPALVLLVYSLIRWLFAE